MQRSWRPNPAQASPKVICVGSGFKDGQHLAFNAGDRRPLKSHVATPRRASGPPWHRDRDAIGTRSRLVALADERLKFLPVSVEYIVIDKSLNSLDTHLFCELPKSPIFSFSDSWGSDHGTNP
jgi:hypothetical protein